jgi:uncharacterized protein (TIGR00159 family)
VAINIFFGIVAFYLLWKFVTALEMKLLSEIFGAFISVGFIALIVVFQPEIRKFLLMLGTPGFLKKRRRRFLLWKFEMNNEIEVELDRILNATKNLAASKTGALIILTNKSELLQFVETGVELNASITEDLIESIFQKNGPLHDGAMIINHRKIRAARCILPVSDNQKIPTSMGLRHRAAVGLTEQSDAVAIIVSEETGNLSYSCNGDLIPRLTSEQLKAKIMEDLG